jgi:hypothetical protein
MFRCFLLASLLLAAGEPLSAQSLGSRVAGLTAPLGDADAALVVHLQLTKLDLAKAVESASEKLKLSDDDRAAIEMAAREPASILKSFREAGALEAAVVLYPNPAAGRPEGEMAAAIAAERGKAKAVADLLRKMTAGSMLTVAERGDVVYLGSTDRIANLKDDVKPNATLVQALDQAAAAPVHVVLMVPGDLRRVIAETLPRLPDEFGGASGKELTEWFRFASISLTLPPEARVKLEVQAANAEAARSLAKVASNWPKLAGSPQEVKEVVPNFDQLTALLAPKAQGDKVTIEIGPDEFMQLAPGIRAGLTAARQAATRAQQINNLKQVALAMHIYHDVNRKFPAQASVDKDGKPLLSWRVHVLPYLEQEALYKQFHLDEPWNSEHNKKLIEKMPKIFEDPRVRLEAGKTTIVVPAGKGTLFPPGDGLKIQQITDGTSNTIMIVEADAKHAVVWTKPADWDFDPREPSAGLFVDLRKQVLAAYADGSVQSLPLPKYEKLLPAMITPQGGEVVER